MTFGAQTHPFGRIWYITIHQQNLKYLTEMIKFTLFLFLDIPAKLDLALLIKINLTVILNKIPLPLKQKGN